MQFCQSYILSDQSQFKCFLNDPCCLVDADSAEKLQQTCPTCPFLLPADSPAAVTAAQVTLESYKRRSTLGAGLGVKKITRAAAQVRPDTVIISHSAASGWTTEGGSDLGVMARQEVCCSSSRMKILLTSPVLVCSLVQSVLFSWFYF